MTQKRLVIELSIVPNPVWMMIALISQRHTPCTRWVKQQAAGRTFTNGHLIWLKSKSGLPRQMLHLAAINPAPHNRKVFYSLIFLIVWFYE